MSRIIEGPVDDFSDGDDFWLTASQPLPDATWDNQADVYAYAELLEG